MKRWPFEGAAVDLERTEREAGRTPSRPAPAPPAGGAVVARGSARRQEQRRHHQHRATAASPRRRRAASTLRGRTIGCGGPPKRGRRGDIHWVVLDRPARRDRPGQHADWSTTAAAAKPHSASAARQRVRAEQPRPAQPHEPRGSAPTSRVEISSEIDSNAITHGHRRHGERLARRPASPPRARLLARQPHHVAEQRHQHHEGDHAVRAKAQA